VKFFRAISGEYQVSVRINQPGSNYRPLRINGDDAILWGVRIVVEHRFIFTLTANPHNVPIKHGHSRVVNNL
jgi:hypothetical protein